MELDDMKHKWREAAEPATELNIEKMIQQKSNGPVAALKSVFRKQMVIMAVLPVIIALTNLNDLHAALTSILFWCYTAFCGAMTAFAAYNYRIAQKMGNMTSHVRTNLEQQVKLLEKRKQWELIGLRIILLTFIALTELVPYIQHYRMLDYWHSLPAVLRFTAYAALVTAQYFINRRLSEHRVGHHLSYLRNLVNEMKD